MRGRMTKTTHDLKLELVVEGGDTSEVDKLARELKMEIENLDIEAVENVSAGPVPEGAKAMDWLVVGQMVVTLAPTVIPPLFELLRSWIERKPSTPVKIRIKVGKKTAQIEYDPIRTSAKDLELLVKSLSKSVKK